MSSIITRESNGLWTNTEYFREEAKHFEKHGFYTPEPWGSPGWYTYWREQLKRCEDGYSVGGNRITGDHYAYLNFAQIKRTAEHMKAAKRTGEVTKKFTFPDFWDGDYDYFHAVEKARLSQKHLIVAKARRKGFSYKNGLIAANRYNTRKRALVGIGAYLSEYLFPNGTMTMAVNYLNFFNEHTGFSKKRLRNSVDHIKAGYQEKINGAWIDKGFLSEIQTFTFMNNSGAARGKDFTLLLLEEAGKFPNLKSVFMETEPALRDGIYTTGQIIMFGTGGGDDSNWQDFEDMFYDCETYNLLSFDNEWDEGTEGTKCGFFFPNYQNLPGFIDKNGNSLKEKSIEHELAIRKKLQETTRDPKTLDKRITEYAHSPKEAFLRLSGNIFPAKELLEQYNKVLTSGIHKNIALNGDLYRSGEEVKFKPSADARPIMEYPYKGSETVGCVTVYQSPYRENKQVPKGMYYVCLDPFGYEEAAKGSLGAAYVLKNVNKISKPDDIIVASYVARPKTLDEFNRNVFLLADYYNAMIGYENDRGSNVLDYAKRMKLVNRLQPEFELAYNDKLKTNSRSGVYGMRIGSGKENIRKLQGLIYLRDWLTLERGTSEEGTKLNLNYIYDLALLQELIKYNAERGNFDRVSALIIGMYMQREMVYSNITPQSNRLADSFFTTPLF